MISNLVLIFLFLKFANSDSAEHTQEQPERLLLEHLLKDYDRDARPVLQNTEKELKVKLSITLKRVVELDVKNQVLTIYIWLMEEWNDPFLAWNPELYANLTSIQIPAQRIWLPDLELYNSADDQLTLSDGVTDTIVKFDGNVSWIEPKEMRANCPVNVFYFPLDEHVCKLQIGSWTMHGDKMDLEPGHEEIEVEDFAKNGEHWSVVKTALNKSVYIYSCCSEPYVDVMASLHLKRKPGHNILSQVLPSVLISLVAILASRLAPESTLRFLIEIVVLLTLLEVIWDVTNEIPVSVSATPLFVIYLSIMISLVCTSIILTAYIASLTTPHSSPAPTYLRILLRISQNTPLTSDLTRDDIPLTQYSFNPSSTGIGTSDNNLPNNGDISLQIPSGNLLLGSGGNAINGNGSSQSQESRWINRLVARKLDLFWFRFFCFCNFYS